MLLYLIYFIYLSPASKMTYIVSGGAINSTHLLTLQKEELFGDINFMTSVSAITTY